MINITITPNETAADIASAMIVGGVSNLLSGKALFNAGMSLVGNLAGQAVILVLVVLI